MTVAAMALALYDVHQAMRRELAALRLHAAMSGPDLAGTVAASVVTLNGLVARADKAIETYVAEAVER